MTGMTPKGARMKKRIALSAIGKDQPGIVAALSKVYYDHGCNMR